MATCILQLALCFGALLFEHFFERITGMADVFAKQFAGGNNIALAAQLEYLVMLFVRPFHAMSQIQLQPGIAFAVVVDVADDGHETRLFGARVEDGVKLPVQAAPSRNVFLLAQFAHVFFQHSVGFREVLFRKMRYR